MNLPNRAGGSKRALRRSLKRRKASGPGHGVVDPLLAESGIVPRTGSFDRPIVGITTATSQAVEPFASGVRADVALAGFATLIQEAGGVPVLLPPVTSVAAVKCHLGLVDAVVFSGGHGMHPNFMGGSPRPDALYDPRKDRYEWQLLDRALENDLPMLAVGRGLVLLNVFCGGSVAQPAQAGVGATSGEPRATADLDQRLRATVVAKTLLARIVGTKEMQINDLESQSVDVLADTLKECAYSARKVLQAAELPDRRFALGVRFHPELMGREEAAGGRLFEALVTAAAGEQLA